MQMNENKKISPNFRRDFFVFPNQLVKCAEKETQSAADFSMPRKIHINTLHPGFQYSCICTNPVGTRTFPFI